MVSERQCMDRIRDRSLFTIVTDGIKWISTALLGCCYKIQCTDPILIHMHFISQLFAFTQDKTNCGHEDTHQYGHFDINLYIFGHLSSTNMMLASFGCD